MKIFVLLSRFPYPIEKGDKLRAYHQIRYLSKNHDIVLCAIHDGKRDEAMLESMKPFCKTIKIIHLNRLHIFLNLVRTIFSKLPFQVGYFYSRGTRKIVREMILKHKPDVVYAQLVRTAELVRHHQGKKVLDYMDALSKGVERRIPKASIFMRPILLWEKFRLIRYEQSVSKSFNALTIISEQDKHYIQNLGLKPIRVIPNGVDTKYFKSSEAVKKYDLLFTGNLSYPPNEDCVRYLSEEIMPFVWKLRPETNLLISGASPTESILRLGNSKINVQGWTEDIRMAYDSASIFVAPMRIGTGMQNKILEAMAMGLPCIASSLVGNGIGHLKGNEMILENDPMAFAQSIVRLIDSKAERERMSKLGVQFVKQYYTWESSVKDLETIFKDSNYSSFN